ncbi:hypothetical protein V6N11_020421 [Hibiscus sabdariffa]|uniref:Uncharacterized protein n=1 Tax=Hibiscus sabdariffa TaxID=183260 RepID=A0ABR2Q8C1_9ROSI
MAARNERESVQIAIRPKVSWSGSSVAGVVLIVGESLKLRRMVPILGVPDALVPLDLPISQTSLQPGETSAGWLSIDVPNAQPPGLYEGELIINAIKADTESSTQCLGKGEKHQLFTELHNCLDAVEPIDGKTLDEVVERVKSATRSLRRLLLSPSFSEFFSDNGPVDMMDEDAISNLSVRVKLSLTVWDFIIPTTPSLPAVFGISDTVIEDQFGVEHGSSKWYDALEQHFKWLLQYRISPYFCRWGILVAETDTWPCLLMCNSNEAAVDYLQKEVEILRTKSHWKKAYFYLWDEPLNMEQYESLCNIASGIHAYAPDARVLTTYYCGPSDAPLAPTPFEAFLKVPKFLRPHTQIYCTRCFLLIIAQMVLLCPEEKVKPFVFVSSEWVFGNREDLVKDVISELQLENGEDREVMLTGGFCLLLCEGNSSQCRGIQSASQVHNDISEFFQSNKRFLKMQNVSLFMQIRFRRGLPPGNGVLYYPGEVFSSSTQPVASLRLERILSGLQDFEYLKLYASRYGREEALGVLEKTGVYLGPERYTMEHMAIDMMRGEIFNTCRSSVS